VIVKSLSRHTTGGIGSLVRYITREQKLTAKRYSNLINFITEKQNENKPVYVAGIKLKKEDIRCLLAATKEEILHSEFKAFKGTVKEFIQQQLQKSNPEIAKAYNTFLE
jgi:hypothetical protein